MRKNVVRFAIYDLATREVLRGQMSASRIGLIELQCGEGEGWVFGTHEQGMVLTDEVTDAAWANESGPPLDKE